MQTPRIPITRSPSAPDDGADRTAAGSNYGDVRPRSNDPSRGSEMERDALPPGADFSRPPATSNDVGHEVAPGKLKPGDTATDSEATRLERIKLAAYARYEQRGQGSRNALDDWLDAEAEVDAQTLARQHDSGLSAD